MAVGDSPAASLPSKAASASEKSLVEMPFTGSAAASRSTSSVACRGQDRRRETNAAGITSCNLAITHTRRRTTPPEHGPGPALPAHVDPERARACEAAYAELGVDSQTILVLRVVERLTYAQIAKTLDIPFRTTLARLASARGALHQRLSPPEQRAA